jgi:hypothetical protein
VDKVRLGLEASSAYWFGLVKYAGYAVAAGCLMEAPETFIIIKKWWLLRFRNLEIEESVKEKKSLLVPLAAVGLIVIVVGIVTETFAEGKVSDVDALIRAHESDKITKAEGEATSAIHEAGDAKGSAEKAAKAAGRANSSADAASLAAGNAVAELLKLRKDAGARRLTGSQKEQLRKTLESISAPIAVGWSPMDSEAGDFANDLISALSAAHWIPKPVLWLPNGKYGICIGFTDPPMKDTPQFKILVSELGKIGMPPSLLQLPVGDKAIGGGGAESHVLYLLIATHPPVASAVRSALKSIP